jgi:hypothetical protein
VGELLAGDAIAGFCIVLFLSVDCPGCIRLLEDVGPTVRHGGTASLLLVVGGARQAVGEPVERFELDPSAVVHEGVHAHLRRAFRIPRAAAVQLRHKRVERTVVPIDRGTLDLALAEHG